MGSRLRGNDEEGESERWENSHAQTSRRHQARGFANPVISVRTARSAKKVHPIF
jgi:hypothetical protein